MSAKHGLRKVGGFILIELIVGMVVASVVVILSVSSLSSVMTNGGKINKKTAELIKLNIDISQLAKDFRNSSLGSDVSGYNADLIVYDRSGYSVVRYEMKDGLVVRGHSKAGRLIEGITKFTNIKIEYCKAGCKFFTPVPASGVKKGSANWFRVTIGHKQDNYKVLFRGMNRETYVEK